MLSFRTVLLLFLFALIAFVGFTNGDPRCGSSSSSDELYDQQAERSLDNADKFGRMTLDCKTTTSGGSGAHNGTKTVINLSIGLFF
ncbi:unnamed protein product [Eruca vesicaria subsp. sativa]|uniref:Uncharacterized protein n=1 Tax=Eruca vesicaria subsp. sativa TaxID=29727 RepID=A0ABC8LN22_ERUVS|nr:unnamed protein product [Eruca vesicaria subsp. sativa]